MIRNIGKPSLVKYPGFEGSHDVDRRRGHVVLNHKRFKVTSDAWILQVPATQDAGHAPSDSAAGAALSRT